MSSMKGMLSNMKRRISGSGQNDGNGIAQPGGQRGAGGVETTPRADVTLPRRERR